MEGCDVVVVVDEGQKETVEKEKIYFMGRWRCWWWWRREEEEEEEEAGGARVGRLWSFFLSPLQKIFRTKMWFVTQNKNS